MVKDIRVEIYGQVYSIRTELDPDYIQQLAQTVDTRMKALGRETDSLDTRRLAVLAALNLADELQQLRKAVEANRHALSPDVVKRLENCTRLLEAALSGHSTA
jgi:cell division protein ZapA